MQILRTVTIAAVAAAHFSQTPARSGPVLVRAVFDGDTIDGLEFVATPLTFGGLQIASTSFSLTGNPVVAISGTVINQTATDRQGVIVSKVIGELTEQTIQSNLRFLAG